MKKIVISVVALSVMVSAEWADCTVFPTSQPDEIAFADTCVMPYMTVTGLDGINGVDGIDGQDGINGVDGINGIDGVDGLDGTNGVDGLPGTDGVDGINGTDGKDGIDGTDGLTGATGATGETGADGQPGADGTDGTDGADGATGPAGTDGTDGQNGTDGSDGLDGNDGTDGVDGTDGLDGKDGSDADITAFVADYNSRIKDLQDYALDSAAGSNAMAVIDFGTTSEGITEVGAGLGMSHSTFGTGYAGALGLKHGITDETAGVIKIWGANSRSYGGGAGVTHRF